MLATFCMWREHLKATGWSTSQSQISGFFFFFSADKTYFTLTNVNYFAFHKYFGTTLITEKFDLYSYTTPKKKILLEMQWPLL